MGKKTMQDRDLDQKNNTRTIMLQRVGGINITRLDESSSSTPRLFLCHSVVDILLPTSHTQAV